MVLASMMKRGEVKIRRHENGAVFLVISSSYSSNVDPTINLDEFFGKQSRRDLEAIRDALENRDLTNSDPILSANSIINDFFKAQSLIQEDPDEPRKSLRGKKHHGFAIPPKRTSRHNGRGLTTRKEARYGRRGRGGTR